MNNLAKLLISCSVTLAMPTWASSPWTGYFNAGPTWIQSANTTLQITPIETDNLRVANVRPVADLGLGAGYTWFFKQVSNQLELLDRITLGLVARYTGIAPYAMNGRVEQFQDPAMTNYSYHLYLNNKRILAEATLNVLSLNQTSIYIKGGVGGGWSYLRYHDEAILGVEGGNASFFVAEKSHTAAEAGVGLAYQYSEQIALTAEYLYTYLGTINLNGFGTLNGAGVLIPPLHFNVDTQGLILGFRIAA